MGPAAHWQLLDGPPDCGPFPTWPREHLQRFHRPVRAEALGRRLETDATRRSSTNRKESRRLSAFRSATSLTSLPREAQRLARRFAPSLVASATWAWKRKHGDHLLGIVDRLVTAGSVAFDLGANWGLFADRLARIVGADGRVHAFEPVPAHAPTLRALARRHGNLDIHLCGLSDRAGTAELHVPLHGQRPITALASLSPSPRTPAASHQVLTVHLDRLDAVIDPPASPVTFIKCDVEGHELQALRGGEDTIRRWLPTLLTEIEERHQGASVEATLDYILSLGYDGWCVRSQGVTPLADFDLERDQLAFLDDRFVPYEMPEGYVNDFIFTRRGCDLEQLLQT